MHVKLEESNTFVKNVVEINSLSEDMGKITLKDSPIQKDKPKLDEQGEVQEVEVAPTLPLSKDWRFATSHPKELIIGDVSEGVTARSKLHDFCDHFVFISHIELKNILKAEGDSYWLLAMQEQLNQFERNQVWHLVPDPMIDQPLVLNRFLGTSWMSRVMMLGIKLGLWPWVTPKSKVSILRKPSQP